MAHATIEQLKAEGWRKDQFGGDFVLDAAFDAYLTEVLNEGAAWAAYKVGEPTYSALSDDYLVGCAKRTELHFAAARLWRRRAAYADSQAGSGLTQSPQMERRAYLSHAERAAADADQQLSELLRILGIDPDVLSGVPAMAVGHIETGRYPIDSRAAING